LHEISLPLLHIGTVSILSPLARNITKLSSLDSYAKSYWSGKKHAPRKILIELENCSNVVISKTAMATKRAMAAGRGWRATKRAMAWAEGGESNGDRDKEGNGEEEDKGKGGESNGNGEKEGESSKGNGDGKKEGDGKEERQL
jgi:hypothetical protein